MRSFPLALPLSAALLLAACAPGHSPKQETPMPQVQPKDPVTEEDWRRAQFTDEFGSVPLLVDADRQIYRFAGGVCRVLRREVGPWTLTQTDVSDNPSHLGLSYNASNTAFGVSVPDRPFDPYTTRNMWLIDLGFGNPYYINARQSMVQWVLAQPELREHPLTLDWAVSPSFKAYRAPLGGQLVFVNTNLEGGVHCDADIFDAPNPNCQGLVVFDDNEVASFVIQVTLLPKLDEVIRSIRELQASIRINCPVTP